ncbi:MAG: queuosine precursor transporter [Candidatus Eisenbacteria bacterium]|nr:queuosine precursor transporter [Candidatus Eisenbacteria bacterium]
MSARADAPAPTGAPSRNPGRAEDALRVTVALFVGVLITSNFIAAKLITVGGLVVPAAVLVFPLAYIIGDVLTEVFGYAAARKAIWLGFACNVVAVAFSHLAIALPPAGAWTLRPFPDTASSQVAFAAVLGPAPRIVAASLAAYLCGEFLNSIVLAKLKVATGGRFLWVRTIGSTLVGQLADSAVFITAAFAGTVPGGVLRDIVLVQWLVKVGFEAAATPGTYLVVWRLKRAVGVEHFDTRVSFNPLRWE